VLAPVASSGQPAAPTDPRIAAIAAAANQVDIDAGKYAKPHARHQDVKAFAERMITDHTGVNKQAGALVTKLHVKPEPNPTSESPIEGGEETIAQPRGLKGAAFERAYVEHGIAYHRQVLDAIDRKLLPNAQNAELKALIEKVRAVIAANLDRAKHR
jgi:putative membrane protein